VAGLHPGLLPGGRAVQDDGDRTTVEEVWGRPVPSTPGRGTGEILRAAAGREIDVLFLVGVDPLRDYPDAVLAQRALENVESKVTVDISADAMSIYADAMLPAAAYLEKDGHYTDWEGRSQRLRPVRNPPGLARSEWEIFQRLSEAMGSDMGFHSLDLLHEEMAKLRAAPVDGRVPSASRVWRSADASPPYAAPPSDSSPTRGQPPAEQSLVLFTYPLLVDEGRLSIGADKLKEALEEPAFVELHSSDAERLGLLDGAVVRLRTSAREVEITVRVTEHVAAGAVFVPWNQPGLAANTLFSGSSITAVSLELAAGKVSA